MVKTLRITSIIVVVLAGVFVVFPVVFGVRSDKQAERFLNSPGAIEQFRKAVGDRAKDSEGRVPPLVKQAEAFALYLNPPAGPAPKATPPSRPGGPATPRPRTVSAKFTLEGTSYYPLRPELSLALIDEPGKGLRWVRQSSKVGHLVIEQVKDGLVVVRDGDRTFELVAERPEKRSLVKSNGLSPPPHIHKDKPVPAVEVDSRVTLPPSHEPDAGITRTRGRRRPGKPSRRSAREAAAAREELLAEMEAMQAATESNEADLEGEDEERTAAIAGFISELKAMRVSEEEAERLDHLGRQLEGFEQEPNQAGYDSTESDASELEPNVDEPDLYEPNLDEPDLYEPNLGEPDLNEPNLSEEYSP